MTPPTGLTYPDAPPDSQSAILAAALYYAELGFPVFPVRPGEKVSAIKGWNTNATTDPREIDAWFENPDFNIGILTGDPSGFFAVDVDPRNGGADSLGMFEDQYGQLPWTVVQHTAGGGVHYLYNMPSDGDVRNGKLAGYAGIDIKGTGGYILAPPSRVGGGEYIWEESSRLGEVPIVDAPQALLDLLGTYPQTSTADVDEIIPEGRRNSTLTSQAGKLRWMGWGEGEILDAIKSMNRNRCEPPLPEHEVETLVHSICRYEPGTLVSARGARAHPEDYNQTDVGNAERLIAYHGQDLRYCPPKNEWLVWDQTRWQPDPGSVVTSRAIGTVRRMYAEAGKHDNADERSKHANHALSSERLERIRAMIWVAGKLEGVPVQPAELDGDRHLLNVSNGTLNLKTLKLQPHRREDLITRIAPVKYIQDAKCPAWRKFLDEVMDGNQEMIRYLQRAAGLCLSGDTSARAFFFLHGTGHNGKSTFLETIRDVLGEYTGDIPPSELMLVKRQDHGKATPFLARLPGARFVTAMETEENERLAAALVKAMTGGRDTITARDVYGKGFSFRPQFKLWIATNHRPRITDATSSIWGRIHTIPFTVHIPDRERGEKPDAKGRIKDPHLDEKLRHELPGILAWLVEGWGEYQSLGLRPPTEVRQATEEYREQEDTAGQFIEECLVVGEQHQTPAKDLKDCLKAWCDRVGESVSWKAVTMRLGDYAGVKSVKPGGIRCWKGVGLRGG